MEGSNGNAAALEAGPREALEGVLYEIKRVIVGQDAMLERLLVALLTGGHVLLEGVPGLAKTLTVKTLADVVSGSFKRVQFTPDLVPADLVGTRIYRPDSGRFDVELGPVLCNFLLADEINRAPAKVQSALLEVMQEDQVTIAGHSYPVPQPFLVLATQNPIESEGTYPLPEAQTDRFLMKLVVDYPSPGEEAAVVGRSLEPRPNVRRRAEASDLLQYRDEVTRVYVDREVIGYAVALADATRNPEAWGIGELAGYIEYGVSPRGPIGLVQAARALALLRGRTHAMLSDVRDLAPDVLRHRLVLSYEALSDGVTADQVLDRVIAAVEPDTGERVAARGHRSGHGGAGRVTRAVPLAPPAGRKGPGPIAGRLVEALDLSFARRAGGPLPGEHRAPGVGAGTELATLRAYQPGDDVRRLDASATARTGEPHVRLDVPERLVSTWVVLDVSPSMAFGTTERLKADVAEGAVRVLARLATRRGGRVALMICGGERELVLPPRGGRGAGAAVEGLLRAGVVPDGSGDPLASSAPSPGSGGWRGCPAWWSWCPTSAAGSRWAARCARSPRATRSRRSRCAIPARPPCPRSAACAGGPRDGAQVEVDTRDRRLRERYAAREREEREAVRTEIRRAGVDHVVLSTEGPWLRDLGGRLQALGGRPR